MIPDAVGILDRCRNRRHILWILVDARRRTLEDAVMGTIMVHDPLGKFPDFDPDKLPAAKIRLYSSYRACGHKRPCLGL